MMNTHLIEGFSRVNENQLSVLIENRRAFTLNNMELNIYETFQASHHVPLQFSDTVLINMIKGKKVMHLKGLDPFEYLPGQMLVLPRNSIMNIDFPEAQFEDPTQCTALTVRQEKITAILHYLNEFHPKESTHDYWDFNLNMMHLYNTPDMAQLINKLFRVMSSPNTMKDALADVTLQEIIICLLQAQSLMQLDQRTETNQTVLNHLKTYIQDHLTDAITMDVLALKSNLSRSSLYRLFKNELGISPIEFVLRERIKKAKTLLKINKSVKETCFSVGFNDVNYFVRIFKKKVGLTPGSYIFQQ